MQAPVLVIIAVVLNVVSLSTFAAGTIYKCKNPAGKGMVYQKSPCPEGWETTDAREEEVREHKTFSVRQGDGGHYFLTGAINNGVSFTFLVDTGATTVALPRVLADASNLICQGDLVTSGTANGLTTACKVVIPKLNFGPFQLENIEAVILPNLEHPLLGMNALQHFNIKQDHGEMQMSEQ